MIENRLRIAAVPRVRGTSPSHSLDAHRGIYVHPGYGRITIGGADRELTFQRGRLSLRLEHWHYDAWAFAANHMAEIDQPHPLDCANCVVFEAADGRTTALSLSLEPALAPIRFHKLLRAESPE